MKLVHAQVSIIESYSKLSLMVSQCSISYHEPYLDLIKCLLPVMPPGLDSFFFWNSGAEAVEQSVKVARQVTRRQNIIVMQGILLDLSRKFVF